MVEQSLFWISTPKYETFFMYPYAFFTVTRAWRQPKCPSIDDWMRTMWYIYTVEYYSAIKKDEILPFATT